MKRIVVLMAVLALAPASRMWGGDKDSKTPVPLSSVLAPAPGAMAGGMAAATNKSPSAWYIESMDKIVHYTPAQKKSIQEIFDSREKLTKAFFAQNAEKIHQVASAMGEAHKSKNNETIVKASRAYTVLFAPITQLVRQSQAALDNVMTAEQKAVLAKHNEEMKKKQVSRLSVAALSSAPGGTNSNAWKSAAAFYIESMDKIVHFTPAQKKSIQEIFDSREKLTKAFFAQNAEKIKAVTSAMGESYKSKNNDTIVKAGRAYAELFAPIHQFLRQSQAALDNVLTAEQKAALAKHYEEMKKAQAVGYPIRREDKKEGISYQLSLQRLPDGNIVFTMPEGARAKGVPLPGGGVMYTIPEGEHLKGTPLPGGGVMYTIPEHGNPFAGGFPGTAGLLKSQLRQAVGLLRQAGLSEEADRVQQKLTALEGIFPGPKGFVYQPLPGQPGSMVERPHHPDSIVAELRHLVQSLIREIKELRAQLDKKR